MYGCLLNQIRVINGHANYGDNSKLLVPFCILDYAKSYEMNVVISSFSAIYESFVLFRYDIKFEVCNLHFNDKTNFREFCDSPALFHRQWNKVISEPRSLELPLLCSFSSRVQVRSGSRILLN